MCVVCCVGVCAEQTGEHMFSRDMLAQRLKWYRFECPCPSCLWLSLDTLSPYDGVLSVWIALRSRRAHTQPTVFLLCRQIFRVFVPVVFLGKQVRVECVYEPPQENYPEGFVVSEDPRADTVEKLAGLLGLKKVSSKARTFWTNVGVACVCGGVCIHVLTA